MFNRIMFKKTIRSFTAGVVTMAMLFTSVPLNSIAFNSRSQNVDARQMRKDMLNTIRAGLESEDEELKSSYPEGIFSIANLSAAVNEDNKDPLVIFLVRHGGTDGNKTVHMKLADYSAEYGKDYYVKLKTSLFSKPVEKNENSVPLLYQFRDGEEEEFPEGSYDELVEAYGEESADEIIRLLNEQAEADSRKETENAGESEAAEDEKTDDSDSSAPALSPLEAMNRSVSMYTGTDTVLPIQEEELSQEDQESAERNARLQDLIFPGTEFDVEFKDGEQIREIYVYPVNNDYSDGDRVFEVRIDVGEGEETAYEPGENSTAVTIYDDEPDEEALISVGKDEVSADDNGVTEIILNRENALYKVSSVEYAVQDDRTGQKIKTGKTVFMPGMDKRTLELRLSDVTDKTADSLTFTLTDATGASIDGDQNTIIDLTVYKEALRQSDDELMSTGDGIYYDKSASDNPLGLAGTLYSDYFSVDMTDDNWDFQHNNECDKYKEEFNQYGLRMEVPNCNCGSKGQVGFAKLASQIYPVMIDSVDFAWCADNFESSTCNRMFVALRTPDNSWEDSWDYLFARAGDIDKYKDNDMSKCETQNSKISLTDGSLTNINQTKGWDNKYLSFKDKFAENRALMKQSQPFTLGVKKTSGGKNGMGLLVKEMHFNLKNFDITICEPEYLPGHNDLPGRLFFDGSQTKASYHALSKVTLQDSNSAQNAGTFAYLKGLQISPDNSNWTDVSDKYFNKDTKVLDLSKDFFANYGDCVNYNYSSSFYIRPVYGNLTVPVTIVSDANGGISVTDSVNGETKLNKGTENQKTIQCNVGDTIKVQSYDVSEGDANGKYNFSDFILTPTSVNGGGDTSQHYRVYDSDPADIPIENCNYTLTPEYTHTGTKVSIDFVGDIPAGCGLTAKTTDAEGNRVNKKEYTYEKDKIRAGQILSIGAQVTEGYQAKWTIMSTGHENYGLTCYGDTLYYKIMTSEGKINLSFEKMENPVYTTVTGKVGTYDGTILSPPAQGEGGEWLSAYVPVANVALQMGAYTGLSGQDGHFTIYSHTEAPDESNTSVTGENVTTYMKLPKGKTQTMPVLIIRNGVRQCEYLKVTPAEDDQQTLSHNGLEISDPTIVKTPDLVVDFYGNGPIPVNYYSLAGDEGAMEDPHNRIGTPGVELRNYSIGFHVSLASVLDQDGNDLVDNVKFTLFHKDGSQGNSYEVKRTEKGQTEYEFLNYQGKDSDGKDMVVNLNGLTDFQNGDQVYVEINGIVTGDDGAETPISYGLYRSGSTMIEVPGEGEEVMFPDISSGSGGGIPTLDVLGTMLPTFKFGRFSVKAEVNSSYMLINVGFDVAQLNKSLYDSKESKRASDAAKVKDSIDETNKKIAADKAAKAEAEAQIADIGRKSNPSKEELEKVAEYEQISKDMDEEINSLNESLNDLNKQYEDLGGTTEVKEQTDPLVAADVNDASVDTKTDFTPDEIVTPASASKDSFTSDNSWSPFSDTAQKTIDNLTKQAKHIGLGDSKGGGFKGTGSISLNINVQLGISVRFKVMSNDQGRGEWCFDYATVYASVSGGLTAMYYMVFPEFPIPLYAGVSATASVGIYNGMTTVSAAKIPIEKFDDGEYDANQILYQGMVPVTFGLEGFIGAGIRNLLCAEMGLGFLQKFNFAWTAGYNGWDSKQSGTGKTSFYGYLSTSLLFFTFKWKFLQVNWDYKLYEEYVTFDDDENLSMTSSDMQPGDPKLTEFEVSEPVTVHYYGEEDELPSLGSGLAWSGTSLVADGLSDTISDTVSLGGGEYLVAYEGALAYDDRASGITDENIKFNNRAVYLTWYDGSNQITRILQKDGTNDSSLHMEDLGDYVIISFASANKIFNKSDLMNGDELKQDALPMVLSSMDMYSVVLRKSEAKAFVQSDPDEKLGKIVRLTDDQKHKGTLSDNIAPGATYLGYGYENGQAELIDGQIYLFYSAVDYNQWKGQEAAKSLSDIIDAKGFELYRIYDLASGKWTENYADPGKSEAAAKAGLAPGTRVADIHLSREGTASPLRPRIGEFDTVSINVLGLERLATAYVIEPDQKVSGNTSGGGADEAALFLAFLEPAKIEGGAVTAEPEWSLPLQMNEDYASVTNPSFQRVSEAGESKVYFMFGQDNDLKYVRLSDMLKTFIHDEETDKNVESIIVKNRMSLSGKYVDSYSYRDGDTTDIGTAVSGGDENKFSLRNGYRIASDDDGHIYVLWAQSEGSAQNLYLSTMSTADDGQNYWSLPQPMEYEGTEDYLENPSFCVGEDGDMVIAHNAYKLKLVVEKNDEGKEVAAGRSHVDDRFCITRQEAVGSAGVDFITTSNDYPKAGEDFIVTSNIINDGMVKADEITVKTSFVKQVGDEVTVLEEAVDVLKDRLPGSNKDISHTFTMKREYIDSALNDGAEFYVETSAFEKGYESEADRAFLAINVGARFVFTDTQVEGFLTNEGNTRYLLRSKVLNDGNIPSDHTKYSMAVSNENRFNTSGDAWNGSSLSPDATEAQTEEALRIAGKSVANNKDFREWLQTDSFVLGDGYEVLGAGEEKVVRLISAQIPDACFSANDSINVALIARDSDRFDPDTRDGSNAVVVAAGKAEDRDASISIMHDRKKVTEALSVDEGGTLRLNSLMIPLRYNIRYGAKWDSSDPGIASVLPDGTVMGLKEGRVTITASAVINGETVCDSCEVIVGDGTSSVSNVYTGKPVKPGDNGDDSLAVYVRGKRLVFGRDYKITYKNNKNAATKDSPKPPTAIVKFRGDFKGMKDYIHTFTIFQMNIKDTAVNNISAPVKKSGAGYKVQKLVPVILYNGMTLKNKKDYDLTYDDTSEGAYSKPGSWRIKVTGKGNYTGEAVLYEVLTEKEGKGNLSGAKISLSGNAPLYDPDAPKPLKPALKVQVKKGGSLVDLAEGTDYEVTYDKNSLPGKATAVVTGLQGSDKCYGSKKYSFTIGMEKKTLSVSGLEGGFTFNEKGVKPGNNYEPDLSVYYGHTKLHYKADYTLSYKNYKDAADQSSGKAPLLTVKLKGLYKGMAEPQTLKYTIDQKDIGDSDVVANDISVLTNNKVQKLVPVVHFDYRTLKNNKNFEAVYGDNGNGAYKDKGTWNVTLNGKGNYKGTLSVNQYMVEKGSLVKLSSAKTVLTGQVLPYDPVDPTPQTPSYTLTVKVNGQNVPLKENEDYVVTYADNVKRGKAIVTFTALPGSQYCFGTKTSSFKIK